jgi:outer membrane protein assembly factor BamA
MQIILAIVGFLLFIPSAVLSRPCLGDSLINGTQDGTIRRNIEPFPILSYDTDTKLGYGAKLFLFNLLRLHESFDMVLFNSTNGERWYHFVFSFPDFELREGTVYPIAIDFILDYDKWLRDNFYGIGNRSIASDVERYTRIPRDMEIDFSRGFSSTFVGQLKIKYMSIENNNFEANSRLAVLSPLLNSGTATFTSLAFTVRFDSRNSFINASSGLVLQGESEFSPEWGLGNTNFTRLTGWIQYYLTLLSSKTVLTGRVGLQQVIGNNIPVQLMSSLGGTGTLRGYPQDRFLDKADMLFNAEIRFPIVWRFGGVVGLDAGKVWSSLAVIDLHRWAYNPITGLRFYMDNFVVRADIGFGSAGTGFYFNFGQLF